MVGRTGQELSYPFLRGLENMQFCDTNPLFAILHEAIYCQGAASRWSAEQVRAQYPEFEPSPDRPVYFTGEMIYPWMFDEYQLLHPLKEAAASSPCSRIMALRMTSARRTGVGQGLDRTRTPFPGFIQDNRPLPCRTRQFRHKAADLTRIEFQGYGQGLGDHSPGRAGCRWGSRSGAPGRCFDRPGGCCQPG